MEVLQNSTKPSQVGRMAGSLASLLRALSTVYI